MDLVDRQRELQIEAFGEDPFARSGEGVVRSFRDNVLAATDELHEALREVPGWKPWSASEPEDDFQNSDAALAVAHELADVQLFLWNLVLNCGLSGAEFDVLCIEVQDKTLERKAGGYAG